MKIYTVEEWVNGGCVFYFMSADETEAKRWLADNEFIAPRIGYREYHNSDHTRLYELLSWDSETHFRWIYCAAMQIMKSAKGKP